MNKLIKYLIITLLFILSITFVSCGNKDQNNLDNPTAVDIEPSDEELDTILLNNGYQLIESNVYSIKNKIIKNIATISSQNDIEKYTDDENFIYKFNNKYVSSFYANHLIILASIDYKCDIYNVYYDGDSIQLIIDNVNKNETYFQTLIFELTLSSLIPDNTYKPILVPSYLVSSCCANINILTVEEAKTVCASNLLKLETPSNEIYFNDKLLNSNDSLIFKQSIQAINYVKTTYDTKIEPLYTIKYDDTTLTIYNNRYFDITNQDGTINARAINSNLLFGLSNIEELNNPNWYTKDIIDYARSFDGLYVYSPEMIRAMIEFAKIISNVEMPSDLEDGIMLEKLEYVYNNVDELNEQQKESLNQFISLIQAMYRTRGYSSKNVTFTHTFTVINNDICGKDIPANIKTIEESETVDIKNYISMVPSTRYLIGWYDNNEYMHSINFNYSFYTNLTLTLKTVAIDDYTLANQEITCVNTNHEIVYLPLFDIEGNEVTTISDNLFKDNTTIKEVYINGNITTIGEHAFDGCTNLEKVVIGSKVASIGDYAFANCPKLETIIFEDGLTTLGNYMFVNDTSIKVVNIPASITDLKDHVFEGCTSIETFNVDENNPKFYSACNNIMEGTTLYYGCKNSTIPDGTVFIREFAFYGVTGLEEIYIPSCVVHIDTSAFHNCSGLKHAYISKSVMWNAKDAFNTGYNTVIDCEYYEKMSGWVKLWTTGTTVNWNVKQPTK